MSAVIDKVWFFIFVFSYPHLPTTTWTFDSGHISESWSRNLSSVRQSENVYLVSGRLLSLITFSVNHSGGQVDGSQGYLLSRQQIYTFQKTH